MIFASCSSDEKSGFTYADESALPVDEWSNSSFKDKENSKLVL
jgi:hypothetical protein